ncbi:MAG: outer membrane protein assembly factor BamB family protein [Planctomycetota bacterium]|jgi:outer membrane protein assembly factor BamB
MRKPGLVLFILHAALCLPASAPAADWPQWRGVNRDGKSDETGLLKRWPDAGPRLLWVANVDIGKGFSSVSVAEDTIYTTGMHGGEGYLYAISTDGKLKWKLKYGGEWKKSRPGTRTTPTVDGDRLYLMSGLGRIVCVDAKEGKEKWGLETLKKFRGRNIDWGIAESPLVYDNTVICTPGGRNATMVALNKMTGDVLWTTRGLSDLSAYCSPILVKDGERNLIVTATANNIVGVDADNGRVLWKLPYRNKSAAHPNTPLYHDGSVYVTSNYGLGGVMLKLSTDGSKIKKSWADTTLDTHHGNVVHVDGYIYGSASAGRRVCLDWKTGNVEYRTRLVFKGSVIAAEGMLYCYDEDGTVALVEATPEKYKIVSSFRIKRGTGQHWAHPAIADGRLYIRHGGALMAFDIRGENWQAGEKKTDEFDAVAKQADEHKAQAKLTLAKAYLRMGARVKAKEMLESIVDEHPQTQAAKQAAQELEKLK